MSAPDPKEWESTFAEGEVVGYAIYQQLQAVARRRAIAELKALAETAEHVGGETWSDWMVDRSVIHDRIAAIEAEE